MNFIAKLNKVERDNYKKYHIPGGANYQHPRVNSISVSDGNTLRHEISKCVGAIMVHKYGDVKFTNRLVDLINQLDREIVLIGLNSQPSAFITEAVPNDNSDRRVDLVILRNDVHVEFETNHSEKKDGAFTIYI